MSMNCLRSPSYLPDGPTSFDEARIRESAQGREASGRKRPRVTSMLGTPRSKGQLAHPFCPYFLAPAASTDDVDQVSAAFRHQGR